MSGYGGHASFAALSTRAKGGDRNRSGTGLDESRIAVELQVTGTEQLRGFAGRHTTRVTQD